MTQENLFELFEHLAQEGFELKVQTKDGKRYINIVTNLPNYNNENSNTQGKEYRVVSEELINNINSSTANRKTKKSKRGYFTPYMTFIKAIKDKHPTLTNDKAKKVGSKFKNDYPDILKVSKKDFNEIISKVNFKYYI
jgi:hypothetical protein